MIPRYRAWIKTENCFADYIESIRFYINEIDLCWGGICESDCFDFKDVILMQSTGLKDKNGKEIFEGDVLEIEDEGEVLGNAKLTWDNEQAVFMIEAISVDDIALFHEILSDESYSYRVVGNVYENKELLENLDWLIEEMEHE